MDTRRESMPYRMDLRRRNERRNVLEQKKLHRQLFNETEEKWLWVRDPTIKRKTTTYNGSTRTDH